MTAHTKTPAAGDDGRKNVSIGLQADRAEITKNHQNLQQRRVAHLARRFGLAPTMAQAVARLAFKEGDQ